MTQISPAALAYTFTQVGDTVTPSQSLTFVEHTTPSQVRFALSSAGVFSRTDAETDSETFYTSVLELLEDPEEQDEVRPLILWWNQ
jgi:hypothetical protein